MSKVLVLFVISFVASISMGVPNVSQLVLVCSPKVSTNYFSRERIYLTFDRSQLPRITAHFRKEEDRYSDYFDPFVDIGELVGTEYFEIINLSGYVSNQYDGLYPNKHKIKLKIINNILNLIEQDQGKYDERKWICVENQI